MVVPRFGLSTILVKNFWAVNFSSFFQSVRDVKESLRAMVKLATGLSPFLINQLSFFVARNGKASGKPSSAELAAAGLQR
jgi:hypothetical protein